MFSYNIRINEIDNLSVDDLLLDCDSHVIVTGSSEFKSYLYFNSLFTHSLHKHYGKTYS